MEQGEIAGPSPTAGTRSSPGYRYITVEPACGACGVEISGVDLSKPLENEVIAELRRAFSDHAVIAFRGQVLPPKQQIEFTSIFGKVEQHPHYRTNAIDGFPEILVLEHKAGQFINGKNDIWHADITFLDAPPLGSILHCLAAWEGFSDTMFANQYMAYETLSEPIKRLLDGLQAEHSAEILIRRNNKHAYNKPIENIAPPVVHPVVRTHPETGRRCLFVNAAYTTRVVGFSDKESRWLLDFLFEHVVQHEFIYRHRWRVGDVVMFDNRCLLHYVVPDHPHDMHRRMHRTTASGGKPY